MSKFLIVNSDDFGMSEGVSRGILEGHHKGIITSTTTMMNMPAAEAAINQALETAPDLALGIHFTLSFGQPLSPAEAIPSLVETDGRFPQSYQALMAKMPHYNYEEIKRELTAQFERFRQIVGKLPTHLDSHHGVTTYSPLGFDVMLEIAHNHNLPIRWGASPEDLPISDTDKQQMQASLQKWGEPKHPDHFADPIFDFERTPRLERLIAGIRNLNDGYTEMMVHVGYAQDLQEAYTFQREEELAAITDKSVQQILKDEGVILCNFADLA